MSRRELLGPTGTGITSGKPVFGPPPALTRNGDGSASGPLARALDLLVEWR